MIPKLDISAPDLFIKAFYFPRLYGPRKKLYDDIKQFKDFFSHHGQSILEEIEKLSGLSWSKERIPVYLFPESYVSPPYSFCKFGLEDDLPGVLQKIGNGLIREVWIQIHELAHVNQRHSEFFRKCEFRSDGKKNVDLAELGADLIALCVIRKLFGADSEYEKDFWDFLENTSEKNRRKYEAVIKHQDMWDLNKNTLRYYIEQTSREDLENLL